MSRYLIRRIEETPTISLMTQTEITGLDGDGHLERVQWRDKRSSSDETREMLLQYRQYLRETQSLHEYGEQLAAQVRSQTEEIEFVKQQLVEIETTAREVLPLMQKMLDTLERFVKLDLPFQLEERRRRVASLRESMDRADVTISEKYRRIVEADVVFSDTAEFATDAAIAAGCTDQISFTGVALSR